MRRAKLALSLARSCTSTTRRQLIGIPGSGCSYHETHPGAMLGCSYGLMVCHSMLGRGHSVSLRRPPAVLPETSALTSLSPLNRLP